MYNDNPNFLRRYDHYYGDIIRTLFIAASAVFLLIILRDQQHLSFYLTMGVFSILALVIFAGLTNPDLHAKLMIKVDLAVSVPLFFLFEYLAIESYIRTQTLFNEIFFLRQLLALIFLTVIYYGVKTVHRSFFSSLNDDEERNKDYEQQQ